jgi:hypothetical protein
MGVVSEQQFLTKLLNFPHKLSNLVYNTYIH